MILLSCFLIIEPTLNVFCVLIIPPALNIFYPKANSTQFLPVRPSLFIPILTPSVCVVCYFFDHLVLWNASFQANTYPSSWTIVVLLQLHHSCFVAYNLMLRLLRPATLFDPVACWTFPTFVAPSISLKKAASVPLILSLSISTPILFLGLPDYLASTSFASMLPATQVSFPHMASVQALSFVLSHSPLCYLVAVVKQPKFTLWYLGFQSQSQLMIPAICILPSPAPTIPPILSPPASSSTLEQNMHSMFSAHVFFFSLRSLKSPCLCTLLSSLHHSSFI